MKVLIIENEKPAAERLCRLLARIDDEIRIVGILETVEGTVNWLEEHDKPDLILMDIQLDDGLCFEVFEIINVETPIIFTTAFDAYTLKAFKVNSVDYLLKPIEEGALSVALNKFKNLRLPIVEDSSPLERVMSGMAKHHKSRFLIKIGSKYRSVEVKDIRYFCVQDKTTFLSTDQGREYPIDYSLDKLQAQLDQDTFYRLNRNCLININAVEDMIAYSSSRLKLVIKDEENSDLFVVSRDKVTDFKKWIDR